MSRTVASSIASLILELVAARGATGSLCPSEVARRLDAVRWRERMDEVRAVASELALEGRIEIAQGGRTLDARAPLRGLIRLRLPRDVR